MDGKLFETGWANAHCKDMIYLCVMYRKPHCTSKQASKRQNVSNSCAGRDLLARGAEEEHDGYQECLNHVTLHHVYMFRAISKLSCAN